MSDRCDITVFGKSGCGLCDAAKDKLHIMEIPFRFVDIGPLAELHEGWRTDGSVEAMAASAVFDGHLPILRIGGALYNYPQAMKALKAKMATSDKQIIVEVAHHAPDRRPKLEIACVQAG